MELLIFFFLVSIVFSFTCSVWEAVLLSIPPSFVAAKEREGRRVGRLLAGFKGNIDRPLAAILTLNTIAHTVGAIGVGAQAARIWGDLYWLGVNVAAVLVPTVMTLAILILSEIIPKTLGANYWRSLAGMTVSALNLVIYVLYPLVWLSQLITQSLKKDKQKSVLSRAEFAAMAEVIAREGVILGSEYRIIQNLLRFHSVRAKDVMTPRTVVAAADQNQTVADFYELNRKIRFSRIPVYEGAQDHVRGFVMREDILAQLIAGRKGMVLKEMVREIAVVREDLALPAVFNTLMERRQHIAMVVDEYGGLAGILTVEDILETLLGLEIVDEYDRAEDMQRLARKIWEERAQKIGLIRERSAT
jgi:CBS domain containing-hemolysin-like protein